MREANNRRVGLGRSEQPLAQFGRQIGQDGQLTSGEAVSFGV
jgi:hypothetical protein